MSYCVRYAQSSHCAISLNEGCFKTSHCPIPCLTCHPYLADFFTRCHSHAKCVTISVIKVLLHCIYFLFYFFKCLNLIRLLSFLHVVKEQPNPVLPVLYCGNSAYHTEAHQSLAPVLRSVSVNWAHLHTRHRSTPRCDTQKCKHVRQKRLS